MYMYVFCVFLFNFMEDVFSCRCGPCKSIAPKFASLSTKYPSAVFLKVDVDQCAVSDFCWYCLG